LAATDVAAWWLEGNFAPVEAEMTCPGLDVEGELPQGLSGAYVRNGFNPPRRDSQHWFFGTGMVHAIEFREGTVSYRNRYVRTPYLERSLDMLGALGDLEASPANTNVIRHGGRLLALEETHLPWEMSTDLDTVGCLDFGGLLTTPMTAHPKICPETGELIFFGYQFMREPWLTYYRADSNGSLVHAAPISIPRPVMMHDFSVTRNHAVFLDLPIVFALDHGGFAFRRDAGARIGLLPRTAGTDDDVRWFEVEPCTVFHVLNSWEEGAKVVLYACRQPSMMDGGMNDLSNTATLWRWTIDTESGRIEECQVDDRQVDFPRVDDRRVGLPCRFGYAASVCAGSSPRFGRDIQRYDLQSGAVASHVLGGAATQTFEPVFAPAGPDAAEDEGWVLVLAHDDDTDTTSLHIIDVQDFSGPPVATVALPQRVPFGAHGNWLPD